MYPDKPARNLRPVGRDDMDKEEIQSLIKCTKLNTSSEDYKAVKLFGEETHFLLKRILYAVNKKRLHFQLGGGGF